MTNFDEIIQRRNSNSYKWDTSDREDILPMWVADMDFRAAQPIIDALLNRVAHGVFGYTKVPSAYYMAVKKWFATRHKFVFDEEWLLYTTGVVPALSAIIRALTAPGDKVIVQSPVYNCFFSSIANNGCEVAYNELRYALGKYKIDFADLEEKARDPKAKLILLCNPHNPVGRVWLREELQQIGEICIKNDVLVVSDEIHCDLVYPGYEHIPFASLSNDFLMNSISCTAPSKTFNLAGLQVSNILAADGNLRSKINKALNINEVCDINPFAVEALMAAYNDGGPWLEELKTYLYANYNFLVAYLSEHLPDLIVLPLEATYLVWIDCSALGKTAASVALELLEGQGLWVNEGTLYGESGENFIRINIACPRLILQDGLSRIRKGLSRQ